MSKKIQLIYFSKFSNEKIQLIQRTSFAIRKSLLHSLGSGLSLNIIFNGLMRKIDAECNKNVTNYFWLQIIFYK